MDNAKKMIWAIFPIIKVNTENRGLFFMVRVGFKVQQISK
jgi:hypothetical protein